MQIEDQPRVVNLGAIIEECQLRVTKAYARDGDAGAIVALGCSSIVIHSYIVAKALKPDAVEHLAETAHNLGMPARLGQAVCDVAIDAGEMFYRDLADAYCGNALSAASVMAA